MDLLIDIGNTRLKWATVEAGELGPMHATVHHDALPMDLHAAWESLPPPERVLVASVAAPTVAAHLTRTGQARWGRPPVFVRPRRHALGVTLAYADPGQLGVDRWLGVLAAHQAHPGHPVLILDAGTAVTYDGLLADGRHLGGLILPGLDAMREALLGRTRIPPPPEAGHPKVGWATDTATALHSGSRQALAALAGDRLRQLEATAGAEAILVLTGGDAERLRPRLEGRVCLQPDLVLRGLARLLNAGEVERGRAGDSPGHPPDRMPAPEA